MILYKSTYIGFLRLTEKYGQTIVEQKSLRDISPIKPTVWAHLFRRSKCALFCGFYVFKERIVMKKVGIVMGSDSDLPIVRKAIDMLDAFGVPYEVHVYSAHRTPVEARDFAVSARENGFGAIIAAAGMAAHLAGAIAANTTLPVIGIPCKSSNLDGMDALLSTVQMPTGIPVATVAINGAANAALICVQMLAIEDKELAAKLDAKRKSDAEAVLAKDAAVAAEFNK